MKYILFSIILCCLIFSCSNLEKLNDEQDDDEDAPAVSPDPEDAEYTWTPNINYLLIGEGVYATIADTYSSGSIQTFLALEGLTAPDAAKMLSYYYPEYPYSYSKKNTVSGLTEKAVWWGKYRTLATARYLVLKFKVKGSGGTGPVGSKNSVRIKLTNHTGSITHLDFIYAFDNTAEYKDIYVVIDSVDKQMRIRDIDGVTTLHNLVDNPANLYQGSNIGTSNFVMYLYDTWVTEIFTLLTYDVIKSTMPGDNAVSKIADASGAWY